MNLEKLDPNAYLGEIGMKIGNWNEISHVDPFETDNIDWLNYSAPKDAKSLFNFSQYILKSIPDGKWKIFQIDNSTYLDFAQIQIFNNFFFKSKNIKITNDGKSIFFTYGNDSIENGKLDLLISNIIYLFLIFEAHAYCVSSRCSDSEILAIQDGYIYFSGRKDAIKKVKELLKNFEGAPSKSPPWVIKMITDAS